MPSQNSLLRPEIPARLFKYMPPERVDFLTTRFLRLTPPYAFNDPFDVSPVATFGTDPVELDRPTVDRGILAGVSETLQKVADRVFNRPQLPQLLASRTHGILCLSDRN